jgi:hypothetical protein
LKEGNILELVFLFPRLCPRRSAIFGASGMAATLVAAIAVKLHCARKPAIGLLRR